MMILFLDYSIDCKEKFIPIEWDLEPAGSNLGDTL